MTVIAAVKTNNGVLMGADSYMADGSRQLRDCQPKLWRVGEALYGAAGAVRVVDAVRNGFAVPEQGADESDETYMRWTFTRALRRFLQEHELLKDDGEGRRTAELELLIVLHGRIWEIDGDLTAVEVSEVFNAIGSGSDVCRAALHALKGRASACDMLREALAITEQHVTSVCGPFVYLAANL